MTNFQTCVVALCVFFIASMVVLDTAIREREATNRASFCPKQ